MGIQHGSIRFEVNITTIISTPKLIYGTPCCQFRVLGGTRRYHHIGTMPRRTVCPVVPVIPIRICWILFPGCLQGMYLNMYSIVRQSTDGVITYRKLYVQNGFSIAASRCRCGIHLYSFSYSIKRIAYQMCRIGTACFNAGKINSNTSQKHIIHTCMLCPINYLYGILVFRNLGAVWNTIVIQVRTCIETMYIDYLCYFCQRRYGDPHFIKRRLRCNFNC